jgi:ATP-dependent DNA ligase
MLAKTTDHLPVTRAMPGGCLYEPKWDGYRGLAAVDLSGQPQIRSRRGTDLTRAFPDIATAVARQLPPGTLLDGELVVWDGDRLDFSQLQRRVISPAHAASLAARVPASYVAFDVLQYRGRDLGGEPLRVRRRQLEAILPTLKPPLQITPATRDRDVAQQWLADYAAAGVGIEGLVIKGLAVRYQPGRRAWLKLRTRSSVEAIVGAVTGTLAAPERLILGLPGVDGTLVVAGGTGPLKPGQQREVAAFLRLPAGAHPWPAEIPFGRVGAWAGKRRLPVTRVRPSLVVEIDADAAYEYGHFRHLTRLIRVRPDLHPDDLSPQDGRA